MLRDVSMRTPTQTPSNHERLEIPPSLQEFKQFTIFSGSIGKENTVLTVKRGYVKIIITARYQNIEVTAAGREIKHLAKENIRHVRARFAARDFGQPAKA